MKKPKQQLSISVGADLVERLDKWIEWQAKNRGYTIDRSHVFGVLIRRFLDLNDSHTKIDPSSLDIDQ